MCMFTTWLGRWWISARLEGCQASDHIWRHHWIWLVRPQDNFQKCLWRPKKSTLSPKNYDHFLVFVPKPDQTISTAMNLKTEATEKWCCSIDGKSTVSRDPTINFNVQLHQRWPKNTFCIHVATRDWRHRLHADVLVWQRAATLKKTLLANLPADKLPPPKPRVYFSYIYLNSNQCSCSISWRFSFPGFWKKKKKKKGLFTLSVEV